MLPVLGADLADALNAVAVALAPVAPAAERFDQFVSQSVHRLENTARAVAEPAIITATPGTAPRPGGTAESPYAPDAKAPEPERRKAEPFLRLNYRYMGQPTVDGMPVTRCRADAQLAARVLPAFEAVGTSSALLDHLKELARSAPALPTI
jgi:hypothetical protein